MVMLTHGSQNLTSYSTKIQVEAESVRKINIGLAVEVQERIARARAKSAWLKAVTEMLESVMLKLAASRMEGASFRWSAHSAAKSASKVEGDVSKAIMAGSIEAADAVNQKISIFEVELKDRFKRVSTQIGMESQAIVLHIRVEPERD